MKKPLEFDLYENVRSRAAHRRLWQARRHALGQWLILGAIWIVFCALFARVLHGFFFP